MSHTKKLWPGHTLNVDNGNVANANNNSNAATSTGIMSSQLSTPYQDSQTGIVISNGSSSVKSSPSASPVTTPNLNQKILSDELLEKNRRRGPGGAPTRATTLPNDPKERKNFPVASGVLDYFPDALVAISEVSKNGNDQHNPGQSLRWDRSKSGDEADAFMRHFLQRGTFDTDGVRHTAKMAWRILALLQKEIENE